MSSDEETDEIIEDYNVEQNILENTEDINIFMSNYSEMKKSYKTSIYLNKYEKTKIISERVQQLANNAKPLIANPQNYSDIYSIAYEELRQKKIPFILKRPINNTFEYWKLEDLHIL
tara:strand:- start:352 stop:702 length:351 start_codon:yes stop_codon:yes gene_type:complete